MAAVQKYSALHMMPFVLATTQLWVQFCQIMLLLHSICCTLLGMLAHFWSNGFIQRPILIVLHVSSSLRWWLAAVPTVDVF